MTEVAVNGLTNWFVKTHFGLNVIKAFTFLKILARKHYRILMAPIDKV